MLFFLECSNVEQNDTSMDKKDEVDRVSPTCNKSTQTEDVLDFTKE